MAAVCDILNSNEVNVQIQTTSVCTAKCIMCPYMESWHRDNPGLMSDELFDRILEQISALKVKKICPYLENEPLADRRIYDRITKIRKMFPDALIEVSTNALALSNENAEKLLSVLCDGKHEIWISFHGMNKRTHEGIMGLPFEKCFANVINLLKEGEKYNANIKLRGAGMGRTSELKHDFQFEKAQYVDFWNSAFKKFNIKNTPGLNFFTYHDRAGSIKRNSIRIDKIIRPNLENFSCVRLNNWLHFLYTGELILCCMDYHRETVFGNILNHSLEEIINSRDYEGLHGSVTGKVDSPKDFICKRCISPGG